MSQIPSDALSTLTALTDAWSEANANTGGQEWPPAGIHSVTLVGVNVGTREKAKRDSQGNMHDATEITFEFFWPGQEDPTTGAEARSITFRGKAFRFFADNSWMTEGQQKYYNVREMARLKGHLSKMLNMDADSLPPMSDCIESLQGQLEEGAEITLKLKVLSEKSNDGNVFNSDFVLANEG